MAEYIELDAAVSLLEEKLRDICPLGRCSRNAVYGADRDLYDKIQSDIEALNSLPVADVVEVVRCKDCKYWHESTGFCSKNSYFIDSNEISCSPLESPIWTMWEENDFCSNGEMKDK